MPPDTAPNGDQDRITDSAAMRSFDHDEMGRRQVEMAKATAAERGASYVVRRDGIDGKREHYVPGNFRRGTGPREKRPFDSQQAAADALGGRPGRVYQCSICEQWHLASEPRW